MQPARTPLIRTLYLYIFSGLGLVLILVGSFWLIKYSVNSSQFDKYPLERYDQLSCDNEFLFKDKAVGDCVEREDSLRKIKKTTDLTYALTMLFLGTLVFIPHWRLARKTS